MPLNRLFIFRHGCLFDSVGAVASGGEWHLSR